MTQAGTFNHGRLLRQRLGEMGAARRWWGFLARLLRASAWWFAVILLIVILDAAVALPGAVRLVLLISLLICVPVALWLSRVRETENETQRNARSLEQQRKLQHNPLVNAVQLSQAGAGEHDALNRELRARAAQHGDEVIAGVEPSALIDRDGFRHGGGVLWAVWVALIVVALLQPWMIAIGLARLALPFADLPPFSFTRIAVHVTPDQPEHGEDAEVSAVLKGRDAEFAELVELDAAQQPLRRWPMWREEDGRFVRPVRQVTEPMRFRVEAGDGRSRRFAIASLPPKPDETAEGASASDDAAPQLSPQQLELDRELAKQLQAILMELSDLREQIEHMQAMAALIEQAQAAGVDPEMIEAMVRALDAELTQTQTRARQLAAKCRLLAADAPPELAKWLFDLADRLEQLSLCKSGTCPNPIVGFTGREGLTGPSGYWVMGIGLAAERDVGALQRLVKLPLPIAWVTLQSGGESDTPPRLWVDPRAAGSTTETPPTGQLSDEDFATLSRNAPAAYRELVAAYYRRLADDAAAMPEP